MLKRLVKAPLHTFWSLKYTIRLIKIENSIESLPVSIEEEFTGVPIVVGKQLLWITQQRVRESSKGTEQGVEPLPCNIERDPLIFLLFVLLAFHSHLVSLASRISDHIVG